MSSDSQPNTEDADGLEAAVDQAIAACGGDMRSTIRALIVANELFQIDILLRSQLRIERQHLSKRFFS